MLHDYAIYGIKKPFDPPKQVTIKGNKYVPLNGIAMCMLLHLKVVFYGVNM